MNGHVVSSFQPPFICKTSSGGTNAEGRFESNLGSTAERGMKGCSVSINRLIDNAFWLICKDERKRRNNRLGEGGSIFPYIKNIPGFLKKMVMFLRNIKVFFENIKVFLQHGSVPKLNRPIPSSAVGARFARPKTVCFVSSGRRTLPLGTKRQHYPHFDTSPCL